MKHPSRILLPFIAVFIFGTCCLSAKGQKPPAVTGAPLYFDSGLLPWPADRDPAVPDLTEDVSNRVYDLHMEVNNCTDFDLIISTAGNWHPALTDYWHDRFLPRTAGFAILHQKSINSLDKLNRNPQ